MVGPDDPPVLQSNVDAHQPHAPIAVQPSHVKAAVAQGSLDVHALETHFQSAVAQVPEVGPVEVPVRQELDDWQ